VLVLAPEPDHSRVVVEAHYAPIVVGAADIHLHGVIPVVLEGNLIVTTHPFVHWCLVLDRPLFVGVYYQTVVVIHTHHKHKHKKHKKHR